MRMNKRFTNESLFEILDYFKFELKIRDSVNIEVLNPSVNNKLYAGETIEIEGETFIYRSYKSWVDLAEILFCKMVVEEIKDFIVILEFVKLDLSQSFHKTEELEKNEKYGEDSQFFRINKNEEPAFFNAYLNSLKNINLENKRSILNLGINRADEFELIEKILPKEIFDNINFVGVDFSKSAIKIAKNRFKSDNFMFYCEDINNLQNLGLEKFDLIISIGTLQSSTLNFKLLFMELIQNYLQKGGAIILGFPNCRWIDSEMIYGAKAPNYSYSEQSILYKDVYFCKKYLQQKKYRVTLTGKDYLFLTATYIN